MKIAFLAALALCAMSVLVFASGNQESDSMKKDTMAKSDTMKKDDGMMKSDSGMSASDSMKSNGSFYDLTGLGTQVVPFTSEQAAMNLAKSQTVVYFFAATWCPDCQATYKDIKANFAQIPKNLTVVVVNYDKSSELKTKYGIVMQHTYVTINAKGEKTKSWSGSGTVAELVKQATTM